MVHTLKLPYKGDHGINLIKSIKTSTKKSLPEKHDVGLFEQAPNQVLCLISKMLQKKNTNMI